MLLVFVYYLVALAVVPLALYPPDIIQFSVRPLIEQTAGCSLFSIDPGIPRGLPDRPRYKSGASRRGLTGVDFGYEGKSNKQIHPLPDLSFLLLTCYALPIATVSYNMSPYEPPVPLVPPKPIDEDTSKSCARSWIWEYASYHRMVSCISR